MFADQIINCSNNNDVDKDDGCSAHDGPDQPGRAGQPRPESAEVRPAPGGAAVRRGRARPGAGAGAGITGWTGRIWSLNFLPKGLYQVR